MIKNENFKMIGIIILLISVVGIVGTYAWFTWSSSDTDQGNTEVTLSIANLANVTFDFDNEIDASIGPVFDYRDGENTTFTINNKSGESVTYTIIINIDEISDVLINENFKYVLIRGDDIVKRGNFSNVSSSSSKEIYTFTSADASIGFSFYIYLDGNNKNADEMMEKRFDGSLQVNGQ